MYKIPIMAKDTHTLPDGRVLGPGTPRLRVKINEVIKAINEHFDADHRVNIDLYESLAAAHRDIQKLTERVDKFEADRVEVDE